MDIDSLEWTPCIGGGFHREHTYVGNMMVHIWFKGTHNQFFCLGPEGDGLNVDVSKDFVVAYQGLVEDENGRHYNNHSHARCVAYPNFTERIPCVESKTWEGVCLILATIEQSIEDNIKEAIYA